MGTIYLFILLFGLPFIRGASVASLENRYDPELGDLLLRTHSLLKDIYEQSERDILQLHHMGLQDPDSIEASDYSKLELANTLAVKKAIRLNQIRQSIKDTLYPERLREKKKSSLVPNRIDEDSKTDAIISESKQVKNSTSFMGNLIPKGENIAFKDLENGDKEEVKESNVTPPLSRYNRISTTTVADTHKALSTEEESNYGTGSVKSSPGKKQKSTIATTGFTERIHKVVLIGSRLVRDKNLNKKEGSVAPLLNSETLSSHISRTSKLQQRQNPVLPYQIPIPYVRRPNDEPSQPIMTMHPQMLEARYFDVPNTRKTEISTTYKRNKRETADQVSEKLQSESGLPSQSALRLDNAENGPTSDDPLVTRSPLSTPTEAFERLKTLVDKTVRDLSKFKQKFTLRLIRMTERDDLTRMPEIMRDFQLSSDRPIFFIAGGLKLAQDVEEQTRTVPTPTTTVSTPTLIPSTSKTESPTLEALLTQSSSKVPEAESSHEINSTPTMPSLVSSIPLTSLSPLSSSATGLPVEPDQLTVDKSQGFISNVNATNENGTESSEISRDETNEEMEVKTRRKRSTFQLQEMEMSPLPNRMARTEDPFEEDFPYEENFEYETFPVELMQFRELGGNTWLNQDAIRQSHLVEDGDKESVGDPIAVGGESGLSPAVDLDQNPSIVKQSETDSLVNSPVASPQVVQAVDENIESTIIGSLSQPLQSEGNTETPNNSMNLNLINPKSSPSPVENSVVLTSTLEKPSVESSSTPEKTIVSTLVENSNSNANSITDGTIEKVEIKETVPVVDSLKVQGDDMVKDAPKSPIPSTDTIQVNSAGIPLESEKLPSTLVNEITPSVPGPVEIIGDKNIVQLITTDSKPVESEISINNEKPVEQEVKVALVAADNESINTPTQEVEPSLEIGSSSTGVNIMTADKTSQSELDLSKNQAQPQVLDSKVTQANTALLQNAITTTQNGVTDIKEDTSANVPLVLQESKPVALQAPEILLSEIPSSTVTETKHNAPTKDIVKVQDDTEVVKNKEPVNELSVGAAITTQTQVKPLVDSVEQDALITPILPSETPYHTQTQTQEYVGFEENPGTIIGADVPTVITESKPVALQVPDIISLETIKPAIEENNNHNTASVEDHLNLDSVGEVTKDKEVAALKEPNPAVALDVPLVLSPVADKEIVPGVVSSQASIPVNLELLNTLPESPAVLTSSPPLINPLPEIIKEQTGESFPEVSQQADLNISKLPASEASVVSSPETIVNVPLEATAIDLNGPIPSAHLADLKQPEEQVDISSLNTNEASPSLGEVAADVIADTENSKITLSPTSSISQESEKNAQTINADIPSNINKPLVSELPKPTSGNIETKIPELEPLPSQLFNTGPDTLTASAPVSLSVNSEVVESSSPNSVLEEDHNLPAFTADNNPNPSLEQIESNLPIITEKPHLMYDNVGSIIAPTSISLVEQKLPEHSSIILPQKTKPDIDLVSVLNIPLNTPAASATIDSELNQGSEGELTKFPTSQNPLSDHEPHNSGIVSITTPIINQDKKPTVVSAAAIADVQVPVATENDNDPDSLPSLISNISPKPLPVAQPAIDLPHLTIPSVSIPVLPPFRPTVPERPHPVNVEGPVLSHEHALAMDPNLPVIIPGPTGSPHIADISNRKKQQLMNSFFPILD